MPFDNLFDVAFAEFAHAGLVFQELGKMTARLIVMVRYGHQVEGLRICGNQVQVFVEQRNTIAHGFQNGFESCGFLSKFTVIGPKERFQLFLFGDVNIGGDESAFGRSAPGIVDLPV